MVPEFHSPAPEFSQIPAESHVLPPEFREYHDFHVKTKKKESLSRRLTNFALCAVVAVSAVAAKPVPAQPVGALAEALADFPLAYSADAPAVLEQYAENELWWRFFSGNCPGAGTFDSPSGEPPAILRDCLTVSSAVHTDGILGLHYLEYSLALPEETAPFVGKIYLLDNQDQVILFSDADGKRQYVLFDPASAEPDVNGCYAVSLPYDFTDQAALSAFGNGADIVGFWENNPDVSTIHVTTEHSHDSGGCGPAYLFTVTNSK